MEFRKVGPFAHTRGMTTWRPVVPDCSGAHTRLEVLRLVVEDLRRTRADAVNAAVQGSSTSRMRREKRTVLGALARHVALAVSDRKRRRPRTCGSWRCSGCAGGSPSPQSPSPGFARRPRGGPPMNCHDTGSTTPAAARPGRQRGAALAQPAGQPSRPRQPPRRPGARRHRIVPAPAGIPGLDRRVQPGAAGQGQSCTPPVS